MFSALASLIISLAVLYVIYLVAEWALGLFPVLPGVFKKIVHVVLAVVAVVNVLSFVSAILGKGTMFIR